jgi:hypothetical protein
MLPDKLGRVLSAYVDGELRPEQAEAVHRLLNHSDEARRLLSRLQADAAHLRSLPRTGPPRDLSQIIVDLPARRTAKSSRPRLPRRKIARWTMYSVAAAVLLAIGLSPLLLRPSRNQKPNASVPDGLMARNGESPSVNSAPAPTPYPGKQESLKGRAAGPALTEPSGPPLAADQEQRPADMLRSTSEQGLGPLPERPSDLKSVAVPVTLNVRLDELTKDKQRQRLLDELRRPSGHRFEFDCSDTGLAMERLQTAFEYAGIQLVLDADAQAELQLKGLKTPSFYVYTENLSPEKLIQTLNGVRDSDRRSAAKGGSQFKEFVVRELIEEDYIKLSHSLGLQPDRLMNGLPLKELSELPPETLGRSKTWPKPIRSQNGPKLPVQASNRLAENGKKLAGIQKDSEIGSTGEEMLKLRPDECTALVAVANNRIRPALPSSQVRLFFSIQRQELSGDSRRFLLLLRAKD